MNTLDLCHHSKKKLSTQNGDAQFLFLPQTINSLRWLLSLWVLHHRHFMETVTQYVFLWLAADPIQSSKVCLGICVYRSSFFTAAKDSVYGWNTSNSIYSLSVNGHGGCPCFSGILGNAIVNISASVFLCVHVLWCCLALSAEYTLRSPGKSLSEGWSTLGWSVDMPMDQLAWLPSWCGEGSSCCCSGKRTWRKETFPFLAFLAFIVLDKFIYSIVATADSFLDIRVGFFRLPM